MDKDKKNNKNAKKFRKMLLEYEDEFESIEKLLDKFPILSNWLITLNLASLGFFLTVLIQIKLNNNTEIPFKVSAFGTIVSFGLSIILGIYAKVKYDIYFHMSKLFRFVKTLKSLLEKGDKIFDTSYSNSLPEINTDGFKELLTKFDTEGFHTVLDILYPQAVLFIFGILLTASYIMRYIFI